MQKLGLIDLTGKIPTAHLKALVSAINYQLVEHFDPIWAKPATLELLTKQLPGYWPIFIKEKLDEAGLAGYHQVSNGIPYAVIKYQEGFEYTISHEIIEMMYNPYIDKLDQTDSSKKIMMEIADATNGLGYKINGIEVSNFVTPDYYNAYADDELKKDFMGVLKKPYELYEGGYMSFLDAYGDYWQAVQAKGRLLVYKLTGKKTAVPAEKNPIAWVIGIAIFFTIIIIKNKISKSKSYGN